MHFRSLNDENISAQFEALLETFSFSPFSFTLGKGGAYSTVPEGWRRKNKGEGLRERAQSHGTKGQQSQDCLVFVQPAGPGSCSPAGALLGGRWDKLATGASVLES